MQAIRPGDPGGVQSTIGSLTRGPSPNLNKTDPLLVFHYLLLRRGEWNISPILGCFISLWKSWKRIMPGQNLTGNRGQWLWALGWEANDERRRKSGLRKKDREMGIAGNECFHFFHISKRERTKRKLTTTNNHTLGKFRKEHVTVFSWSRGWVGTAYCCGIALPKCYQSPVCCQLEKNAQEC